MVGLLIPACLAARTAAKPGAPQGRIINLASSAHYMSYPGEWILDEKDLHSSAKYQPWRAYGQSKLSNVLHARELNARLHQERREGDKGEVVAVAVHPGVIETGESTPRPSSPRPSLARSFTKPSQAILLND